MIFWTAQEPKHLAVKKSELHLDCSDRIEILMFIIYILEQSTALLTKKFCMLVIALTTVNVNILSVKRTQTILKKS